MVGDSYRNKILKYSIVAAVALNAGAGYSNDSLKYSDLNKALVAPAMNVGALIDHSKNLESLIDSINFEQKRCSERIKIDSSPSDIEESFYQALTNIISSNLITLRWLENKYSLKLKYGDSWPRPRKIRAISEHLANIFVKENYFFGFFKQDSYSFVFGKIISRKNCNISLFDSSVEYDFYNIEKNLADSKLGNSTMHFYNGIIVADNSKISRLDLKQKELMIEKQEYEMVGEMLFNKYNTQPLDNKLSFGGNEYNVSEIKKALGLIARLKYSRYTNDILNDINFSDIDFASFYFKNEISERFWNHRNNFLLNLKMKSPTLNNASSELFVRQHFNEIYRELLGSGRFIIENLADSLSKPLINLLKYGNPKNSRVFYDKYQKNK